MTDKIYKIVCEGYPMLKKFPIKILNIIGPTDSAIATVEIISHNQINHTLPNYWEYVPKNKYAHGDYHYHFNKNELTGFQFKIPYSSLLLIKS